MPFKKKTARKKPAKKAAPKKKVSAKKKLEKFTGSQLKGAYIAELQEKYGKLSSEKVMAHGKMAKKRIQKKMSAVARELRKLC